MKFSVMTIGGTRITDTDCFGKRIALGTEIMSKAEAGEYLPPLLIYKYNAAVQECELKITWEERNEANENST